MTRALAFASRRLVGLDVFRGATIAGMILVNSQASPEEAYRPFVHAPWHGLTFADTIFPAFLFIVGVSLTLSTAARVQRGEDQGGLIAHAVRRSALLFVAGLFIDALVFPYHAFPFFTFENHLHLTGVLQKIAVCYFVAFLVYLRGGIQGVITAIVGLNLVYLALLFCYVIATLALGVGVNTAIFSLTREVLLRPLPYRDADRLVRVFETSPTLGRTSAPIAPINYVAWRDHVDAFEQTAAFRRVTFNVSMKPSAVQVEGFLVASTFFPMLGVEPALGRGFADEDAQPGHDAVVLLSDGFWRRQFAADAAIVGQSIEVDGAPCTVIGSSLDESRRGEAHSSMSRDSRARMAHRSRGGLDGLRQRADRHG